MAKFCNKYVVLMEVLYRDKELNQWCRNYSAYRRNTTHCELKELIYDGFMHEAYELGLPKVLSWKPYGTYRFESALTGTVEDLIYGICLEIRMDYGSNGSLIKRAIAEGNLYRLMSAYLHLENRRQYTLDYVIAQESSSGEKAPGACAVRYDKSMHKWCLQIQLDEEQLWFLSVFIREDGSFAEYSLDQESAFDSHYEFKEEQKIRNKLYVSGDENKFFHEILIRYVKEHGGEALRSLIMPYVTAQFHFD